MSREFIEASKKAREEWGWGDFRVVNGPHRYLPGAVIAPSDLLYAGIDSRPSVHITVQDAKGRYAHLLLTYASTEQMEKSHAWMRWKLREGQWIRAYGNFYGEFRYPSMSEFDFYGSSRGQSRSMVLPDLFTPRIPPIEEWSDLMSCERSKAYWETLYRRGHIAAMDIFSEEGPRWLWTSDLYAEGRFAPDTDIKAEDMRRKAAGERPVRYSDPQRRREFPLKYTLLEAPGISQHPIGVIAEAKRAAAAAQPHHPQPILSNLN